MDKAIYVQPGGGYDRVIMGHCPAPLPERGEITVRLHASSLNHHDFLVISGAWPRTEQRIPMSDGAGEVLEVGDGVTDFVVGDAVVSTFFPDWVDGEPIHEDFAAASGDGIDGYARQVVTRSANAFTHAPKGWSYAEAATLPTAGLMAWRVLVSNARVKAGDTVLVQGTGGVAIYTIQLAKMMGATVIATSSSADKLQRIKALGADHVINYREDRNWGTTARQLTGGRGVDVVVDVGGPGTLMQSMIAARVGGHVSMAGMLTGDIAEFSLRTALFKQLHLQGVLLGSRREQQDMVRAFSACSVRPVIDREFAMEDIVSAFHYQETGQHFGKIVLKI